MRPSISELLAPDGSSVSSNSEIATLLITIFLVYLLLRTLLLLQQLIRQPLTPVHKKGAHNLVSNYQLVSLTSVFCKPPLKIVMSPLMDNNLISPQ